jgi:hypothetical protein
MSPEHATGAEVDGRSDLYAMGVLLFELLSGQKPFDGELQDILRAHFTAPVPDMAERNPKLSSRPDLQALVERAMAKEREQRFASAAEMIAALDEARSAPAPALGARAPGSRLATRVGGGLARAARGAGRLLRYKVLPLLARAARACGRGLLATLRFGGRKLRDFFVWLGPHVKRGGLWLLRACRTGLVRLFKRERAPAPALLPAVNDLAAATVIDAELVSRVLATDSASHTEARASTGPFSRTERSPSGELPAPADAPAAADAARRAMQEDLTLDDEAARSGSGPAKG